MIACEPFPPSLSSWTCLVHVVTLLSFRARRSGSRSGSCALPSPCSSCCLPPSSPSSWRDGATVPVGPASLERSPSPLPSDALAALGSPLFPSTASVSDAFQVLPPSSASHHPGWCRQPKAVPWAAAGWLLCPTQGHLVRQRVCGWRVIMQQCSQTPASLLRIHRWKGGLLCCQERGEIRGKQGRGFSPDPRGSAVQRQGGFRPSPEREAMANSVVFAPHRTPPSPTLDVTG